MPKTMGRPPAPGSILDLARQHGITAAMLAENWGVSISQVHRINRNPYPWHWHSVCHMIDTNLLNNRKSTMKYTIAMAPQGINGPLVESKVLRFETQDQAQIAADRCHIETGNLHIVVKLDD